MRTFLAPAREGLRGLFAAILDSTTVPLAGSGVDVKQAGQTRDRAQAGAGGSRRGVAVAHAALDSCMPGPRSIASSSIVGAICVVECLNQQLAAPGVRNQVIRQFRGDDADAPDQRFVELVRLRRAAVPRAGTRLPDSNRSTSHPQLRSTSEQDADAHFQRVMVTRVPTPTVGFNLEFVHQASAPVSPKPEAVAGGPAIRQREFEIRRCRGPDLRNVSRNPRLTPSSASPT